MTKAKLNKSFQKCNNCEWQKIININMGRSVGLTSTHRQIRELISGPSLTVNTRLLSSNRMQSWATASLWTGHNILKRHPLHNGGDRVCAGYQQHRKKPQLMLWASVKLWPHSDTPIWLPILNPKHVRNLSLGAIWDVFKEIGLPWFRIWFKGHKGPVIKA
jgi:hypothetical protein